MTDSLQEACATAVHVITIDGEILRAGLASMFILREIGAFPGWLLAPMMRPPLLVLIEGGYKLVAHNRAFFGRFLFKEEKF